MASRNAAPAPYRLQTVRQQWPWAVVMRRAQQPREAWVVYSLRRMPSRRRPVRTALPEVERRQSARALPAVSSLPNRRDLRGQRFC